MIKDIQDKILARSVHGGSTGLEQQKAKRYPQKLKPAEYKYPFIKEEVKKNHDIDLVFMAGGIVGYHCVEEDAEYMKKKFDKICSQIREKITDLDIESKKIIPLINLPDD